MKVTSSIQGVFFYLGFITNPKNGEVKALSVRVPWLDVFKEIKDLNQLSEVVVKVWQSYRIENPLKKQSGGLFLGLSK